VEKHLPLQRVLDRDVRALQFDEDESSGRPETNSSNFIRSSLPAPLERVTCALVDRRTGERAK
jgi:hypothetical protein